MGEFSHIEWCHHTFNPWWGCVKVSPACDNCYAEALAKRFGTGWGKEAPRRFFGAKHWNEPLRWNRKAAAAGERHRVFCSSMADVFEDRRDLDEHRERLWKLIDATPNLDWLLLTKRPNKVKKLAPWSDNWPDNVWLGCTVEEQKFVTQRLDQLLKHDARVHFISSEPLLGPLDLSGYLDYLSWVIVGGESGPGARPTKPEWVTGVRDQCEAAKVPFHFKQWGDHGPDLIRIGKKIAGRQLDGRTWDELPENRLMA